MPTQLDETDDIGKTGCRSKEQAEAELGRGGHGASLASRAQSGKRHPECNAPSRLPNALLTIHRQSPLYPNFPVDVNKGRTYKNIIATREMQMLTFIKDFAAFVTLGAFTIGSLTWMDMLARLV